MGFNVRLWSFLYINVHGLNMDKFYCITFFAKLLYCIYIYIKTNFVDIQWAIMIVKVVRQRPNNSSALYMLGMRSIRKDGVLFYRCHFISNYFLSTKVQNSVTIFSFPRHARASNLYVLADVPKLYVES